MALFWLFLLPTLSNPVFAGPANRCDDLARGENPKQIEKLNRRLAEEDFGSGRGLDEYLDKFEGTGLKNQLFALKPDEVWIDMGAGEGARALLDFVSSKKYRGTALGVTLKAPEDPAGMDSITKGTRGRFRLISGNPIEEIPLESLPRARVITDLFGAFSYTLHVDLVMERYLSLLETGGSLHLYYMPYVNEIRPRSGSGPRESILSWFLEIKGVEVEAGADPYVIQIRKISE
ncbi:MAG: hypothetical protein EBX52_04095, partial [Proteobacteria bacterium]|nr:hypothetical protein [Pseudomonadota bacterium]